MRLLSKIRPYLPLIAGLIIVAVIAVLVPWKSILGLLSRFKIETVLLLFAMSVIYYSAKSFRFWVMLRQLAINKPYPLVAMSYMAAQPVSLLPAGELYRTKLLEKYAEVPVHKSSPTVFMQGLIEAIVLLAVAMLGALSLGKNQILVLGVTFLLLALLVAIKRGWLTGLGKVASKLPFVDVSRTRMNKFFSDNKIFLTREHLTPLLLLTIPPIAAGIVIVYTAAGSIGAHLSIVQSAIAYCLPVVLSGLSFLPGGLGASEGGTIGLLNIMDVPIPEAVAITLIVRVFTLGAGLVFGMIGVITAHTVEVGHD